MTKTAWTGCTATAAKPHASGHYVGKNVSVALHSQCLIRSTIWSRQAKKHASSWKRAKSQTTARNSLMNLKRWVTAKCGVQEQPFVHCVQANQRKSKPLLFYLCLILIIFSLINSYSLFAGLANLLYLRARLLCHARLPLDYVVIAS